MTRRVLLAVTLCAVSMACYSQTVQSHGATSLGDVKLIYIEPMPGGFNQYLTGALLRRLPDGVSLTNDRSQADAELTGTDQEPMGGGERVANQTSTVGGAASGAVELVNPAGQILWADQQNDHTIPIYGLFRNHGVTKVAARIAKDLSSALKDARKKQKKDK